MAGHLGDARVTARNLEVHSADAARNLLLIEGAVPGAKNSLVIIKKSRIVVSDWLLVGDKVRTKY